MSTEPLKMDNNDTTQPETVKQSLNITLKKLKSVVETNSIASSITPFTGRDSESYASWIGEIEKYSILTRVDEENVKLIAYQSSRGAVSDFLKRRITSETTKNESWESLKQVLASRFAYITDEHVAFLMLRQAKQMKNESVVLFSERLINLANNSFLGQDVNSDYVDRETLHIFTDGLLSDSLRYRLMKLAPKTLNEAIQIAIQEETLKKRFDLRTNTNADRHHYRNTASRNQTNPPPTNQSSAPPDRVEEMMEIDSLRPKNTSFSRCPRCHMMHHKSRPCLIRRNQINQVNQSQPHNNGNQPRSHNPITCYSCGKTGHPSYLCKTLKITPPHNASGNRAPLREIPPRNQQHFGQLKCYHCGKPGHKRADCPNKENQGNY